MSQTTTRHRGAERTADRACKAIQRLARYAAKHHTPIGPLGVIDFIHGIELHANARLRFAKERIPAPRRQEN